jgi:two-component system sensor histidine kinase UhpB
MSRPAMGLRARVGLVLSGVLAASILLASLWWVSETRRAIGEEIEAASRVAEQWLNVLIAATLRDGSDGHTRLLDHLRAVGRLRANQLEVIDATGTRLYVSPEPTYKAGRDAPAWLAAHITPPLAVRRFDAGTWQLVLRPDASRAVLDAWDDLKAGLGWVAAIMLSIMLATHAALNRALAPLQQIDAALARGAEGRFDQRLPSYRVAELDRLAASYNRLADQLDQTEACKLRLEREQVFAHTLHERLTEERRLIARELHDELGQSITAVRAISGALLQRDDHPQIHGSAQAILAMTSRMQNGVHAILQRLRPPSTEGSAQLDQAVARYCALWASHHPTIRVDCHTTPPHTPPGETVGIAVLRLLQESLTNVARHSGASHVEVHLHCAADTVALEVRDDGRGLPTRPNPTRHGLAGMRERVAELHGELELESPDSGGLRIRARLPCATPQENRDHDIHA